MNLSTWERSVAGLVWTLRRRYPTMTALDVLAHPPDKPCPPPCPSCGNRHRPTGRKCPCVICHTSHDAGVCPPYRPDERGRPGCLVCRNVDDHARAVSVADLGDGVRSPSLEPGVGGGGPTSRGRPPAAPAERWWTSPPNPQAQGEDEGGADTPTERAALRIDHSDALALADAAMHRERVLDFLRLALHERSTQ